MLQARVRIDRRELKSFMITVSSLGVGEGRSVVMVCLISL